MTKARAVLRPLDCLWCHAAPIGPWGVFCSLDCRNRWLMEFCEDWHEPDWRPRAPRRRKVAVL